MTTVFIETDSLHKIRTIYHPLVSVVIPSINIEKAKEVAKNLTLRAGLNEAEFVIVVVSDKDGLGFVKIVNQIFDLLTSRFVVYTAEDAFPGRFWLKFALQTITQSPKGLLAFNDGKWYGSLAAFGMVDRNWVSNLYDAGIFYPGYKRHFADVELTEHAKLQSQYVYNPNAVLVELDMSKNQNWTSDPNDHALYRDRALEFGFKR
jgi:hypothetical protein